jgi:hypothetical protein
VKSEDLRGLEKRKVQMSGKDKKGGSPMDIDELNRQAAQVSRLCVNAGRSDLIVGFLQQRLTPEQATRKLAVSSPATPATATSRTNPFSLKAVARQVASIVSGPRVSGLRTKLERMASENYRRKAESEKALAR